MAWPLWLICERHHGSGTPALVVAVTTSADPVVADSSRRRTRSVPCVRGNVGDGEGKWASRLNLQFRPKKLTESPSFDWPSLRSTPWMLNSSKTSNNRSWHYGVCAASLLQGRGAHSRPALICSDCLMADFRTPRG